MKKYLPAAANSILTSPASSPQLLSNLTTRFVVFVGMPSFPATVSSATATRAEASASPLTGWTSLRVAFLISDSGT